MSERKKPYPFDVFEPKWQQIWDERKTFKVSNPGEEGFDASKPKYYVLDMFPYPSGAGLHVGHPEGYTATDIVARFKRMNGFNVLHPMGWDSSAFPRSNTPSRPGSTPPSPPSKTLTTSAASSRCWASPMTGTGK